MTNAVKVQVARQMAEELDQIERQLNELQEDASKIAFHRAEIRLNRASWLCRSTAHGLRQQAGKLKP